MKILVTGAAGFIGSHAAERFAEMGHTVVGVDNFDPYYDIALKRLNAAAIKAAGVEIIEKDLRDEDLADVLPADVDYIFHFAAQPGISITSKFEDYLSNNVVATKRLLDYATRCDGLRMFVNIATSSIYGLEATTPEDAAPKPASYYGVTKLAAEQLALQQSREGNMRVCSLRLYSVIGPRERPEKMYTKLIHCGLNDLSFPLYEGSDKHLRSFTYVGDIIDGVASVIGRENEIDGEIFNIGTEAEHSTRDGITAVETVLGKTIAIEVVPKRPGDQLRTKADISKARRVLGYNPVTSLMESVQHQVEWYKAHFL